MEQLSLFKNEGYPDTRPMKLLNTSKNMYLDNATLEVIQGYFDVEGMDFDMDPEDEDYKDYLNLFLDVRANLSVWDFYRTHRDMSTQTVTQIFTTFSASIMKSCYVYIDDHDDNDYEENEEFIDFIDRIDRIINKHYEALLNEWFEAKSLNPNVESKSEEILKYKGKFYKILQNNLSTKSYWLHNKCTFRHVLYLEDFHNVQVYSKKRYYYIRLFSKALFSGIKSFFKKGAEEFNKEIKSV